MSVQVIPPHVVERIVADIAHPAWSPKSDLHLIDARRSGTSLDRIAQGLMMPFALVSQRYHRLRIMPQAREAIAIYAKSHTSYDQAGG